MNLRKKPAVYVPVTIGILGLLYVFMSFLQLDSDVDDRITDSVKLFVVVVLCAIGFFSGRTYLRFTRTTPIFVMAMVFLTLFHVTELTEEFSSMESLPMLGEGGVVKGVYSSVMLIGTICFFYRGNIFFGIEG